VRAPGQVLKGSSYYLLAVNENQMCSLLDEREREVGFINGWMPGSGYSRLLPTLRYWATSFACDTTHYYIWGFAVPVSVIAVTRKQKPSIMSNGGKSGKMLSPRYAKKIIMLRSING
jgi:hypothetical protein